MGRLSPIHVAGIGLPLLALATTSALAGLVPQSLVSYGPAIFLASAVVLGLPHGAVDHLVMAKLDGGGFTPRVLLGLAAYVGAVLATLVAWWVAPTLVFVGFILLTLFHWGQGDIWFHQRVWGARPSWSGVVLAGGLPMLVPLIAFPEVYASVAEGFVGAAGIELDLHQSVASLRWWSLGILGLAAMHRLHTAGRGHGAVAVETVALACFFAVVPPVAAIAIYFCFWHAPRHLLRISETIYAPDFRGLEQTLVAAIPLTLVSLVGLAALLGLVGTESVFSVYLALIAALTVPHVAVVIAMDAQEKVWG